MRLFLLISISSLILGCVSSSRSSASYVYTMQSPSHFRWLGSSPL